jgi:GNAT superfamily N-acetyltransferase
MTWRWAQKRDCRLLAEMNFQLIEDERHRNTMDVGDLERRMRSWLQEGYEAVIFEHDREPASYALYRAEAAEVHLRHFFVARHLRRRGIGREAFGLLRDHIWPRVPRLTVSVLTHNDAAMKFWRAMGYKDYCLAMEILR